MANTIDILIRSQNVTGSGITAATQQVAGLQSSVNGMANQVASAMSGVGGLGGRLGALTSALGPAGIAAGAAAAALAGLSAAAFGSVSALSDSVEQLDRLSARTGVGTTELQVMQRIVKDAGGSTETLTTALSFLNRAIAEQNPMLGALGINTTNVFDAFRQLSGILASSTNSAANTKIAMELLGRGGTDLLGVIRQLAKDYPAMADAMRAAGLTLEGDVLGTLRDFDSQTEKAAMAWDGMMMRIRSSVAPAALAVITWANKMWDALSGKVDQAAEVQRLETAIAQIQASIETGSTVTTEGGRYDALSIEGKSRALENMKRMLSDLRQQTVEFGPAGDPAAVAASVDAALRAAEAARQKESADKKAAESAKLHAEAVRQVAAAMGVTTAEASRLLDVYERVEKNRAMDKLREKIVAAQEAAKSLNTLIDEALAKPVEPPGLRKTGPIGTFKPTGTVEGPDPRVLEAMRAAAPAQQMRDMLDNWRELTEQVFSGAELLNSGLQTVQQGLTAGFQTAFASMLSGAMSFARAMRSIFASLANAIIAEMARLMAMQAIKTLVTIATGGVPITSNAGVVAGIPSPVPAVGDVGAVPMGATINNVTINALDARSVLQQTVSPSGALRLTNTRMAELAAVA